MTEPVRRVRRFALLIEDENDKQSIALGLLADELTRAESAKDWAKVGEVNVALRAIARGLAAKEDVDA
jgi:hypothetical protein